MKVKIGPYRERITPYCLLAPLKFLFNISEEREEAFAKRLSPFFEKYYYFLDRFKIKRKIKVKIDYYDTWSMDETLAHIIHPMLVQLKETTHGSPKVEDVDVPEEIRSYKDPKYISSNNPYEMDEYFFARWSYVLDEMIWAFEQMKNDWENEFYTDLNGQLIFDKDSYYEHHQRMQNGFRLFGKYYMGLWD